MAAEDPYGIQRAAAAAAIEQAEMTIFQAAWDLLKTWAGKLRNAVFGTSRIPDINGVWATEPWFGHQLDTVLLPVIGDVAHDTEIRTFTDVIPVPDGTWTPNANAHTETYLMTVRNRLVGIPDSVFAQVNRMTMAATRDGSGVEELAAQIDELLIDTGADRWKNRAMTIARTEAVGAYNGGTFQGFKNLATSLGGEWEKGWLATEDERTRPTHRHADGQRVPLNSAFTVGGYPGMFPGSPELPAQEVINCRCSMLLLRPDEQINYAGRQSRARSRG